MRTFVFGMIASLTIQAVPVPVHAAMLSPGKNIALASAPSFGTSLPSGDMPIASASIVKAKKKSVITIEGTLATVLTPAVGALQLRAIVTSPSSSANAQGGVVTIDCTGSFMNGTCSVSGNWWIDIDALEALEPGFWANQPVDVFLMGGTLPDPGSAGYGWYSLTARLEKK